MYVVIFGVFGHNQVLPKREVRFHGSKKSAIIMANTLSNLLLR